jgi:hypothetical protein
MKAEITISSVKTIINLPTVVNQRSSREPRELGFSASGRRDTSFLAGI